MEMELNLLLNKIKLNFVKKISKLIFKKIQKTS